VGRVFRPSPPRAAAYPLRFGHGETNRKGRPGRYRLHRPSRQAQRRHRGGSAMGTERRGAHPLRPRIHHRSQRREGHAPLPRRPLRQLPLLPLRRRDRRRGHWLPLRRAARGLSRFQTQDLGRRRRHLRRSRPPQPRHRPRPRRRVQQVGPRERRQRRLLTSRRRQPPRPQVLRAAGLPRSFGIRSEGIL
ncbi:MAG: hypothetical protein AVDCRST_MAG14-812, partial [uncultured Rubrobacteraceae bacterium]